MFRYTAMALHKIFVYGTLLKGQPNHTVLLNVDNGLSKFVGKARLSKKYPLVVASRYNIPFLLPLEGTGQEVHGEVYEVDSKMLVALDVLEEHPDYYTRAPVQCLLTECEKEARVEQLLDCEAYFLFNYKKELLSLPMLSRYDSYAPGQKPYCPVESRDHPSRIEVKE